MTKVQHRARLLLLSQQEEVLKEYSIDEQAIIGRLSSSNIVINDDEVSRIHAQIFSTPKGFYISDLDSTNGTVLNGKYIENNRLMPLQSNDTVKFGSVKLIFQIVPSSVPAPQPQTPVQTSTITESPFSVPYRAPVHNLSAEAKNKQNNQVVKETLNNIQHDNINAKKNLLTSLRERLKSTKNNINNKQQVLPVSTINNQDDEDLGGITSTITETPIKDFSQTFQDVKTHNLFEGINNYNSQETANPAVNYQPPFPSEELEQTKLTDESLDFLRDTAENKSQLKQPKLKSNTQQTHKKSWLKNIAEDIKLTVTGKSPQNKFISYSLIGLTVGASVFAYYRYTPIFS